jgi:thymidylate synthase (FAD)
MLNDNGHKAMLEFSDITVRFITNRGISHELVRHRLCNFAESSTRYINHKDNMEFIRPVWCSEKILGSWKDGNLPEMDIPQFNYDFIYCCIGSEFDYKTFLKNGWIPEQAREVLPNSLKTEILAKANVREWQHILDLRCSKKAHPQMRGLLIPLLKELQERIPILFDGISAE